MSNLRHKATRISRILENIGSSDSIQRAQLRKLIEKELEDEMPISLSDLAFLVVRIFYYGYKLGQKDLKKEIRRIL